MGSPWLSRLAVAAAAASALTLSTATAAWADTTIDIKDAHVPTTAADFGNKDCTGPFEGLSDEFNGWHFVLPGNDDADKSAGDFVSVTLTFEDNADVEKTFGPMTPGVSASALADEDTISYQFVSTGNDQIKHLYVVTLAGWTLTGATATITGTADDFNLSHTCLGTKQPPSTTKPPSSSAPPSSGGSSSSSAPGASGGLPVTGAPVGGILAGGIVLVAAGVALMAVRRRRAVSELTES